MALPPSLALKVAAALAAAFAVGAADRHAAPRGPDIPGLLELRTAVAVARGEGNRWVVEDSRIAQLLPPHGPALEQTCRRSYRFRDHHWSDGGCSKAILKPPRT